MAETEWWDLPLVPAAAGVAGVEDRSRFLRLHRAPRGGRAHGTVVVLHGGYWKNKFGLDDAYGNAGTISLHRFFWEKGFSAVEVEYRRRDHPGGGWPGTNEDILSALTRISQLKAEGLEEGLPLSPQLGEAIQSLRPERLILLGHSAGGCLALWAAQRWSGTAGAVAPLVLAAAPVADLVKGYEMKVSDEGDAVELYMKQPPTSESALEAYRLASPAANLPVSFPLLIVYGDADADVPPELVKAYAHAARAGAPALVSVLEISQADHFQVVDATSDAWRQAIVPALAQLVRQHYGEEAAMALESN
ncbi:unnamed protein product [Durusdinium trenchii]|uniref:Peptidase S9 prolyl oligopeptidase catalytic domain-containing protein n=2 Tax=Durusdinium trenchii TaxID=1381693 RepID=A0ABP0N1I4_9DINO